MLQPAQVWSWMLNGLRGLVEMLDHPAAPATMNADQRKRLKDAIDRLTTLHAKLERENHDNG